MDASEQIRRSSNQDERECSNRGCPLAIRCAGNDEYVERTGIVEETVVWEVGFFSDFCFGGTWPSGVGKRSSDAPTLQRIAAEVVAATLGSATCSDNVSLQ
jgi:hypothetical protein